MPSWSGLLPPNSCHSLLPCEETRIQRFLYYILSPALLVANETGLKHCKLWKYNNQYCLKKFYFALCVLDTAHPSSGVVRKSENMQ